MTEREASLAGVLLALLICAMSSRDYEDQVQYEDYLKSQDYSEYVQAHYRVMGR